MSQLFTDEDDILGLRGKPDRLKRQIDQELVSLGCSRSRSSRPVSTRLSRPWRWTRGNASSSKDVMSGKRPVSDISQGSPGVLNFFQQNRNLPSAPAQARSARHRLRNRRPGQRGAW